MSSHPMSVAVGDRGIRIDGIEHRLWSGEVHYWRLDPDDWGAVLDAVAGLGFGLLSTYVPWAVHEVERARFDFSGRRDLARFCEMAATRGLWVMVRPGPDCASELVDSGWPRRVLSDERVWARRCDGRPYVLPTATWHVFPPSYASDVFLEEVALWFGAVCEVIAPLQHPAGPVVACQVDNELGFHFQGHAYAMDYHPDAKADYRAWLGDEAAEPPRGPDDGTESDRVAWVAWREEHLRSTLARLGGMLRDRGITVPLVHNDYPRTATPQDLGALEQTGAVDLSGADVYSGRSGGRFVRDLARHLSGSSRLPYLAELGAGWVTVPWLLPMPANALDEEIVALRALLSGVRAANVYMLVDRDRWYAAPVARDGTLREKASLYPRIGRLLDRLWGLRRHAPVLLLENRDENRRAAARDRWGDLVPAFGQMLPLDLRLFSPPHPDTEALRTWERALAAALDAAGVDADRATTTAMPDLTDYEAVLLPTFEALDPDVWQRLHEAAEAGIRVGVGPRVPTLDGRLRPHDFEPMPVLDDPSDAYALLPAPPVGRDHDAVDLHLWTGNGREVLACFSSSAEPVRTTLAFGGPVECQDLWGGGATLHTDGDLVIDFEPWDARVWEVRR